MLKKIMFISSVGYMITSLLEPVPKTSHIKIGVGNYKIVNIYKKELSMEDKIKEYIKSKNPKLDYRIIYGICNAESSFKEKTKNKNSSATGCMQIIYSTGKWIHKDILKLKTEYNHSDNLNYKYNIDLSIAYLDLLYDKYKGNHEKIILAYRGEKDLIYLKKVFAYARKTI